MRQNTAYLRVIEMVEQQLGIYTTMKALHCCSDNEAIHVWVQDGFLPCDRDNWWKGHHSFCSTFRKGPIVAIAYSISVSVGTITTLLDAAFDGICSDRDKTDTLKELINRELIG